MGRCSREWEGCNWNPPLPASDQWTAVGYNARYTLTTTPPDFTDIPTPGIEVFHRWRAENSGHMPCDWNQLPDVIDVRDEICGKTGMRAYFIYDKAELRYVTEDDIEYIRGCMASVSGRRLFDTDHHSPAFVMGYLDSQED
jgi:hypothetical protein